MTTTGVPRSTAGEHRAGAAGKGILRYEDHVTGSGTGDSGRGARDAPGVHPGAGKSERVAQRPRQQHRLVVDARGRVLLCYDHDAMVGKVLPADCMTLSIPPRARRGTMKTSVGATEGRWDVLSPGVIDGKGSAMVGWHTAAVSNRRGIRPRALDGETVPDVVAVTGGDGFIGSHLVERLVAEGARVRAMARYTAVGSGGGSTSCRPT